MRTERNRKVAEDLFASLSMGDLRGALALLTRDATWTIVGHREELPSAGTYSRPRLAKLMKAMRGRLEAPMIFHITGRITEGSRMALEAEAVGRLANGRTYRQRFHFALEFRGGRICAVREYLDTLHTRNVWYSK